VRSRQVFLSLAVVASWVTIPAAVPKPPARDVHATLDAYLTSASRNEETLLEECAKNGYIACCGMREAALRRRTLIDKAVRAAKAGKCEVAAQFAAETQCNSNPAFFLILHHQQDVCSMLAVH
jgi:hypothetical protein